MRDVFLCHASEDKAAVVRPLARAFAANTISCWLDEAEIKWGDSISDKVNQGLRDAHFAILVLSPATLQKHWQQREINAVLNLEAGSGEVRALPLLVGTDEEVQTIIAHYPLLNDKLYQRWQGDPAPIVEAMQQRLGGTQLREAMQHVKDHAPPPQKPAIHIPRLKKPFTDLDKDRFIKQAFAVIRDYFKEGLKQLDTAHPEIDVDFTEITSIKFVCKAYVNGDLKAQRRIWLGGITGSHEISFLDGEQSYDTDNHYNGWVSVADDGYDLFLTDTTLTFYGNSPDKLSPEEAAELLWKGFTDQLTW